MYIENAICSRNIKGATTLVYKLKSHPRNFKRRRRGTHIPMINLLLLPTKLSNQGWAVPKEQL